MSNRKNDISNGERKESRKKMFYRIAAFILALLMVGGGLVSFIYSLIGSSSAAEPVNTSDMQISVGLMYGTDVTHGFETSTVNGFIIGSQSLSGDAKPFTELWRTDIKKISVTCDANLKKSAMTYSITASEQNAAVGGYHIEIDRDISSKSEVSQIIDGAASSLAGLNLYAFPAYVNGAYRVRIGGFSSSNDAVARMTTVTAIFSDNLMVTSPSKTAVSLLDPMTDTIIFEYDRGETTAVLGTKPIPSPDKKEYIRTPAANLYDGVFAYNRYRYEGTDGVSVINVLPLEDYVAGVLPYEISNSWPLEVQKAFAVTVRSYTMANLKRHNYSYEFDICNTQHCQVYKGVNRINDVVTKAVEETKGQVLTYDNKVASTYYSSSTGGVTVSSKEAWGGADESYLVAVDTPWERYTSYSNGFWTVEVSPTALLDYLKNTKGYSNLSGSVSSVVVEKFAENSTYVYQLKITDTNGESVIIQNTDKVRSTLGAYLKSANFVVGKGSVAYTEKLTSTPAPAVETPATEETSADYTSLGGMQVMTHDGVVQSMSGTASVITDGGLENYEGSGAFVISDANADSYNEDGSHVKPSEPAAPPTEINEGEVVQKVAYAAKEGNFIFVGKGWGHGVGMSQYGAKDLAELGYDFNYILNAYFPKTAIEKYTNLPRK